MAAIETLDFPTSTVSVARETGDRTTPYRGRGELPTSEPSQLRPSRSRTHGTAALVEPEECGDEELRNEAEPAGRFQPTKVTDTHGDDGDAARARSEVARDVLHRVERLVPMVGDVALPVNIELLKKDLARCHDVLGHRPSESNFLSIVTLVESVISQLKWKQYDQSQLEQIGLAIAVGYRQGHVTYDDYAQVRTAFADARIDASPRIHLESLDLKDLTDDEPDDEEE
ncbi:MAG: hypothetical protein GXY83_42295 [Rhodopirellula sp.]|nr:hypothetical protein [Rhodopirellula sp.]